MKRISFTANEKLDGMRLDLAIVAEDVGLSRRKIRSIIDIGGAWVNNKRVRISSRSVRRGDKIRLEFNPDAMKKLKRKVEPLKESDLLMYADGVIAINKPAGLPAQATSNQSVHHVTTAVEALLKTMNKKERLTLVHRLDMETSGVMLVATNKETANHLSAQFKNHTIKKTYLALCHGTPKKKEFTEKVRLLPINRKTGNVCWGENGKSAETNFRCLASNSKMGITLMECRPKTGRSHQIRVHLLKNDLPILGDKRYGGKSLKSLPDEIADLVSSHQMLHASRIEFELSGQNSKTQLFCDVPQNFQNVQKQANLIVVRREKVLPKDL